jgi:DNA-binding transcriptional LysR family regulator
VLALVEAGLGAALVPGLALRGVTTSAQLRPVAEFPLFRRILTATRTGSAHHPAATAVTAALAASAGPD